MKRTNPEVTRELGKRAHRIDKAARRCMKHFYEKGRPGQLVRRMWWHKRRWPGAECSDGREDVSFFESRDILGSKTPSDSVFRGNSPMLSPVRPVRLFAASIEVNDWSRYDLHHQDLVALFSPNGRVLSEMSAFSLIGGAELIPWVTVPPSDDAPIARFVHSSLCDYARPGALEMTLFLYGFELRRAMGGA